jgi:hypothetical protein
MDQNNLPVYSNSLPGPFQAMDPQLLATIEAMFQSKLGEVEQRYNQEIQARDEERQRREEEMQTRDEEWKKREEEMQTREAGFQAQLQALTCQLAAAKTQSRCVLWSFYQNIISQSQNTSAAEDSHMLESRGSSGPALEAPVRTQTQTRARRHQRAPMATPVTSQNLRMSKHPATTNPALSSRARGEANVAKKAVSSKKTKHAGNPSHAHRLLASEVPEDVGGLQVRFLFFLAIGNFFTDISR